MSSNQFRWLSAPRLHFPALPSTNRYLLNLPEEQAIDGMSCMADTQTCGYGRGDRIWTSPYGGLYLSVLLLPPVSIRFRHLISFVMAVASAKSIKGLYPDTAPGLKWPNDILINNRKIAGILLESNSNSSRLVVGIGINVSVPPERLPQRLLFPAGIINLETKYPTSVKQLAECLLTEFFRLYEEWLSNRKSILTQWEEWSIMKNKMISINVSGSPVYGLFHGIAEDGALQLLVNHKVATFYSGDVTGVIDDDSCN